MIALLLFTFYALCELVLFVWIGNSVSWLLAFGLIIAFFVWGLIIMSSAGISAVTATREIFGGEAPAKSAPKIGDATITFAAGFVVAMPGLITSTLALISLIPFVRNRSKGAVAKYARYRFHRSGLTVVTLAYDGFKRSRFYQGDVVPGDVVVEEGIVDENGVVISESAVVIEGEIEPPSAPNSGA
ncbi:MAG: FxsA family protein [Candidatus Nanopelagicales bacterium]